jgi:hypothetical protein
MRVKALYLINLPSLKLGLCENLLHQLMQLDEGEGIPPQNVDTVVFVLVKKNALKRGNDSNEKDATDQDKDIRQIEENWRKGKPTQSHAEEKKQVRRCNNRKKKIETETGEKKQKEHNTEM